MNSFPQHFPFLFFRLITLKKLKEMVKVTVCGAAGGIGQPLYMLLKQSPYVSHLSLYDIVNTPGVAADLRYVTLVLS
jgi:glycerate kinase